MSKQAPTKTALSLRLRVSELAQSVNREELEMFCIAFQAKKNSIKIKGNSIKKASLKRKEGHILAFLEEVLGSDYQLIKEQVLSQSS